MLHRNDKIRAGLILSLLMLLSAGHAKAQTTDECVLEYSRADNMWGSLEDSFRSLGRETIRLQPGQKRAFVTDWRFEKVRNDGSTYYGSHARTHLNRGTRVIKITYKPTAIKVATFYLDPGQASQLKGITGSLQATRSGDIVEVACP